MNCEIGVSFTQGILPVVLLAFRAADIVHPEDPFVADNDDFGALAHIIFGKKLYRHFRSDAVGVARRTPIRGFIWSSALILNLGSSRGSGIHHSFKLRRCVATVGEVIGNRLLSTS